MNPNNLGRNHSSQKVLRIRIVGTDAQPANQRDENNGIAVRVTRASIYQNVNKRYRAPRFLFHFCFEAISNSHRRGISYHRINNGAHHASIQKFLFVFFFSFYSRHFSVVFIHSVQATSETLPVKIQCKCAIQ